MSKKVLLALTLVLALVSVACGAQPIKIGYLANLTGDAATWGVHEKNGALIAVEEINKKGGVLGRPLEVVVYDVTAKAEDAISAARRLILEGQGRRHRRDELQRPEYRHHSHPGAVQGSPDRKLPDQPRRDGGPQDQQGHVRTPSGSASPIPTRARSSPSTSSIS